MARQNIGLGAVPGDGNGDKLYIGGDKINDNFIELYAAEALNTAKVTNATHTGDATGSGVLTLATVNASPGTYTNATITVNGKGLVTAASSGAGSVVSKYYSLQDISAGTTSHVTTFTTAPYSLIIRDSTGKIITHTLDITVTTSSGFTALSIYSFDPLNNCQIYMLY